MQLDLLLPHQEQVDKTEFAVEAEDLEYNRVWIGELWGEDSFVKLTEMAIQTETVGIGTSIVNVYSRSPATLAVAAASVDRIADGRMRLGVGTSTPKIVRDLHGIEFDVPIRRVHESGEIIKRYLSDENRVSYEGDIFEVTDFPGLERDIPVYNAAIGNANCRATGRVYDGWMPHNIPFPKLAESYDRIQSAAEEAGRPPDSIEIAPHVPTAVSEDPSEAKGAIRQHIAYYAGSAEPYRRAMARLFPDEVEKITELWRDGRRTKAKDTVTDEMIHAFGVAGTPESVRDQIISLLETTCIETPIIVPPHKMEMDMIRRTIRETAPTNF